MRRGQEAPLKFFSTPWKNLLDIVWKYWSYFENFGPFLENSSPHLVSQAGYGPEYKPRTKSASKAVVKVGKTPLPRCKKLQYCVREKFQLLMKSSVAIKYHFRQSSWSRLLLDSLVEAMMGFPMKSCRHRFQSRCYLIWLSTTKLFSTCATTIYVTWWRKMAKTIFDWYTTQKLLKERKITFTSPTLEMCNDILKLFCTTCAIFRQ